MSGFFKQSTGYYMPLVVAKVEINLGAPPKIFAGKTATVVDTASAAAMYFAKSSPGLFSLTSHG